MKIKHFKNVHFNESKNLYNKCKINKCFQKVLNRNCI